MDKSSLEPTFHFYIALYLEIGSREIRLLKQPGATENSEKYIGEMLPGYPPLNIKNLLNRILSTFDLQLPQFIPDIQFDSVNIEIDRTVTKTNGQPPSTKVDASYDISAQSKSLATKPFGSLIPIEEFKNFNFLLKSSTTAASKFILLGADIVFSNTITFLQQVSAKLILANNASIIGIEINQTLSSSQLIGQLLNTTIPQEIQQFLPSITPLSPGPMRFYQATESLTVINENGASVQYQKGFNIDHACLDILDQQFSIVLNVQANNGFTIGAGLAPLDLGILSLNKPSKQGPSYDPAILNPGLGGPIIQVTKYSSPTPTHAISLATNIQFFGNPGVDLFALYVTNTKTFIGTMRYNDSILGVSNPQLTIAWSKQNGFQILSFPIPAKKLESIIDFASEIKKIINQAKDPNACGPLVDFVFSKTVTTKFTINVKPTAAGGKPTLSISGSYNIYVAGYEIDGIDFLPLNVPLSVPKSLDDVGNAIISTLANSAQALVQALYDNREQFIKLLAVQGLKQGAQQAASNFICRFGEKALENMVKDAASTATSAATGAAMNTLAGAAAAFAAATAALSFFAKIIKCLTSSQKEERDKANEAKRNAQQKINELLKINNLSITYQYSANQVSIKASWDKISGTDGTLHVKIINAQGVSVYDVSGLNSNTTQASVNVSNSGTYTINVNGNYDYQGTSFTGPLAQAQTAIPTLTIENAQVNYDTTANTITVSWNPSTGILSPNGALVTPDHYTVALWDTTLNQSVPGMLKTVSNTQTTQVVLNLIPTSPPLFNPQPTHQYEIRIQAIAANPVFNSAIWTKSVQPPIAGGVGHTLVGLTFKVD